MSRRSNGSARADGIEHAHICVRMRAPARKKNSGVSPEKNWIRNEGNGMRDRVNCSIDHRIKKMFEALQENHRKEWSELLEEATIEFLKKMDPVQTLEDTIRVEDEKQEERRKALIKVKANVSMLEMQETDPEILSKELQRKRIERISVDFNMYANQWKHGSDHVNWSRIIDFGEFKDIKDAKKWLETELKEKGLMPKHVHYS
jgi:hypothetical protein